MDVRFHQKKADLEATQEIYIFNPDISNFSWNYAGVEYIIPAKEMVKFKKHIADHLAKHLCDHLCNKAEKFGPAQRAEFMKLIMADE